MADHTLEHELTRHAAALRSMARALVHPGDVDDLVQETALAVLRTPPAQPSRLGGLLMTILRQLASKQRRGEARRLQRERAAAKPEAVAGAEHELARHEMVERLTRALVSLPEPYRDTLMQRFFEDRRPAQIAERGGVPVETVKTRIKRGLQMLRERLDGEDGGRGEWRAALAGVFGFGRSATVGTAAAVTTGVLLMGTGAKLLMGGAAAVVAVAAALFFANGAPPAGPAQQVARADAPAPVTGNAGANAEAAIAAPIDRREVATSPPAPTTPLATIRGRCVDENGTPVAGVSARLTGRLREDRRPTFQGRIDWDDPPEQTTAEDGRFELRLTPPPPFSFQLMVGSREQMGGYIRWDQLTTGQIIDLGDVPVFRPLRARARVRDTDGAPLGRGNIQLQWTPPPELRSPLEISVDVVERTDAAGFCKWSRLLPGSYHVTVHDREVVSGAEFSLTRGQDDSFHEVVLAAVAAADLISGTVVDDTGAPLPYISVMGRVGEQGRTESTMTDKSGAFRFLRKTGDGDHTVRFSISKDGFEILPDAERWPWGRTDVRLVLRCGVAVEVLAVTTAGQPVENYRIWVVPDQVHFQGGSSHDTDVRSEGVHPGGLATITALPRGPYFVVVQPADEALAISRPVPVQAGDTLARAIVQLRPAPHRRARVQRGDGTPVANCRIRLIDPAGLAPLVPGYAVPMPMWTLYTVNGARLQEQPYPILLQETFTDARGEATLRGCDDQPVTVSVQGAAHCPTQVDGVRLDTDEPLQITVSTGATIVGTTQPEVLRALRELAGLPPTGKVTGWKEQMLPALTLARGNARHPETFPPPGEFVPFDDDGHFAFANVPPGSWPLVLHTFPNSQPHTEVVANLELRDGETTTLQLDLSALLPGELSGQVFWNDQPLDSSKPADEKLQLHVVSKDLAGRPLKYWNLLQTDANGRFVWRGRAGTVTLDKTMILSAAESVVLKPGAKVTQDFHGSSGILRIHVLDSDGKPVPRFSIELLDAAGQRCPSLPWTDADGASQRELPLGTYRVETLPKRLLDQEAAAEYLRTHPHGDDAFAGVRIHLGDITIAAGQTTETTLRLPPEWNR